MSEQNEDSKNAKPRGRPKKGHISPDMPEAAPKKNFLWTDSMENYLLELRLQKYKRGFLDAKDKVCISRTWASILMDFNIKFGTDVSSEQLKNKFNVLKSSYREVKSSFVETGNTPGKEIPPNFDTLNEFFQGRDGLSGSCFGESDSQYSENVSSSKKKASNSNNALVDAFNQMGENISNALLTMAERPRNNEMYEENKREIQGLKDEMTVIKKDIKEGNEEILKILRNIISKE